MKKAVLIPLVAALLLGIAIGLVVAFVEPSESLAVALTALGSLILLVWALPYSLRARRMQEESARSEGTLRLVVISWPSESGEIVKVHQAAIRAKKTNGPEPSLGEFGSIFGNALDKKRRGGRAPFSVPAGRTRPNPLASKKLKQFGGAEIRPGHDFDPTPLQRA